MTQLVILARITSNIGKEADVADALQALAIPTREEVGCLRYDIYQDPRNVALSLIHEIWESYELWRAHVATDHVQLFKRDILADHAEMTVDKLLEMPSAGL